jgi:hypothetical protein
LVWTEGSTDDPTFADSPEGSGKIGISGRVASAKCREFSGNNLTQSASTIKRTTPKNNSYFFLSYSQTMTKLPIA